MLDERVKLDRDHPRADQRRAGQPGRGDRRGGPRGGRALPARRLPVGRAAAPRRAGASAATCCRPPGASTCAGRAATGLLYVRRELADRLEPPLLDLHAAEWVRRRPLRDPPATHGASRTGRATSPASSASGRPRDYARAWGLDGDRGARRRARRAPARRARARSPASRVRDLGVRRCGIVSLHRRRPLVERRQGRPGAPGHQRRGLARALHALRHGRARDAGPRPGLGPLLQQRGRGRRARRGGGRLGRERMLRGSNVGLAPRRG